MKALLAGLVLILHPTMNAKPPLDLDRMIEAVSQIEGGKWGQPGGPCCIGYSAWSQHTNLPFQASMHPETALPVYREHLEWIIYNLPKHHCPVTAATVYLCWRRGLHGAVAILRKIEMPEQATRCQNLYESLPPSEEGQHHVLGEH